MNRGDALRARRCRAIVLAAVFGALLPVFNPSWITAVAAVAGLALLALVYLRECRHRDVRDSAPPGSHP